MSRDAFDKVFDVILDDVAKEADEKLGNELEEYEGTIEYSKNHKRKMKKLFKAQRRKENKKQTIKTVFICVLMAIIIFVSLFAFCEPFRVKVLNTYLELKENINFNFSFSSNSNDSYKDEYIELCYVPNGFEVSEKDDTRVLYSLYFKNKNMYFQISYGTTNVNSSIDTENGIVEPININNNNALFTHNHNLNSIVWNANKKSIRLFGNISKAQLVKIAENLKILK